MFDSQTGRLRINSTVEPFIERDSGAYQQFLDARKAFGSEEVVVIALHNTEKKPIGLEFIMTLAHLKSDIETTVPGITKVLSMLDIPQASGECAGKSYFHQMGIGSVCFSVLEKYEQDISCLNSTASSSTQDTEGNLEESLEGGLEESLESNLEESPGSNLEESLEEGTDDSAVVQSETEMLEETVPDCSLVKSGKSPDQLRNDAAAEVSKIVSSLKNHPLFEGDVLSKNLSTAALIITFSPGSKPESDNTQTILKGLLSKHQKDSEIAETLRIAYAGQPRQINKASRLIRQDMALILPLSLMLIVVVLLIAFRSIRAVIVPLSVVLFGILWTAGIIGLIGDELNLVTMACAPIIVCVGSAYVIKFLNQYQIESLQIREAKKSGVPQPTIPEVVYATLSSVTVPVTVTAITTVAGFYCTCSESNSGSSATGPVFKCRYNFHQFIYSHISTCFTALLPSAGFSTNGKSERTTRSLFSSNCRMASAVFQAFDLDLDDSCLHYGSWYAATEYQQFFKVFSGRKSTG